MIETATITAADDWKYTFKDLDKYDKESKEYLYKIQETPIESYTTEINAKDNGFELLIQ